jgi:hypothetical protein
MRTRRVSILKYLFRNKGGPPNPADIWQPGVPAAKNFTACGRAACLAGWPAAAPGPLMCARVLP